MNEENLKDAKIMQRVQRTRTKPLPPGTIYVGRPTRWGNPYRLTAERNREEALFLYRQWLKHVLENNPRFLDPLSQATALACWCKLTEACHADILLEYIKRAVDNDPRIKDHDWPGPVPP